MAGLRVPAGGRGGDPRPASRGRGVGTVDKREALIRRHFEACNATDHAALVSWLTPDAVHYFPPVLPGAPLARRGRHREGLGLVRGDAWRSVDHRARAGRPRERRARRLPEAVIEWTYWKSKQNTALRGDEWYRFDRASGLISEIRAYYASPAQQGVPMNEPHDFDYAGRGYHLRAD